jgi:hypothetical protein
MTASAPVARHPASSFVPERSGLLSLLRVAAAEARAAPRLGLGPACALIAADPDAGAARHVDALVRVLPEALERRPVIRMPGGGEPSFDEAWFCALLEADRRGDVASLMFLLRRRVVAHARGRLLALVRGLRASLDAAGKEASLTDSRASHGQPNPSSCAERMRP